MARARSWSARYPSRVVPWGRPPASAGLHRRGGHRCGASLKPETRKTKTMTTDGSVLDGLRLLAVLALVLANGFFVAAEFSLVAVRRSRVEELVLQGRRNAA